MHTSSSRHTTQTRDQVLVAHAANQIARTHLSQDDFAQALSRELHLACSGKAGSKDVPDFNDPKLTSNASEFVKATGRWLRRVHRWISGESEFPSWLEEAWVNALEPEYRDQCINELASRHGLVGARLLLTAGCANKSYGALIRVFGELIATGSEIFDDQIMGTEDMPHLPEFVRECRQAMSRLSELEDKATTLISEAHPTLRSIA